jgi:hypothetical protein
MQQIKKQLSHLNLHHIQEDVLQPIAKAIHQSPSPIHFHKVKSHAGILGGEENTHHDAKTSSTNQERTLLYGE